ncbi:MAG: DM13 domain-containing protein [Ginsengibacter sp.]
MHLQKLTRLFFAVMLFSILMSCKKASTETLNEMVSSASVSKYSGNFISQGGENVSGQAQIYFDNSDYVLKLADFSSSNGPDLKVYLSKAASPLDYISLGDLKSTNGNQVYKITGTPDFTLYHYVLIHCEKYNHRYGSADLMK